MMVDKIGNYLYQQDIIGYVTAEFIVFSDGKKTLFWAIDLKLGLTDIITQIQFTENLNRMTIGKNNIKEVISLNTNTKINYYFAIPSFISPKISYLRMKDLVNVFRSEQLIYDMDKKSGIIFNIPDVIQAGMIGLMGVSNSHKDSLQLMEDSIYAFNSILSTTSKDQINSEIKYDDVEAIELIGRLKLYIKSKLKQLNLY